jgi:hypothetical protein
MRSMNLRDSYLIVIATILESRESQGTIGSIDFLIYLLTGAKVTVIDECSWIAGLIRS